MKKKTRNLLIIAVALLVAAAAVVTVMQFSGKQASAPENGDIKLYWNVEQEHYEDPASGKSLRTKNEDGEYTVLMAVDGKQERLRCTQQELVDKMDSARIVGLSVTKDQMITQVYTLEELNRGKAIWQFYIQTIDENGLITAFSAEGLRGERQQAQLGEGVEIYYTPGDDILSGIKTDVRELDRVMGVTDDQGNLTHLYVIDRVYTGAGEMRYCEHCKQEVKWWSWDDPTYLPTVRGHFYLTGDVQMTKQSLVRENIEIVLDLQGHTITSKANNRIFAT